MESLKDVIQGTRMEHVGPCVHGARDRGMNLILVDLEIPMDFSILKSPHT